MKMFEKPVIFNFNPENNLYLSKNNFKIVQPEDFTLLSLPSPFQQLSLTSLKMSETFREKLPQLFKLVPKEVLLAKDPQMMAFSNGLMIPLVTPSEYQGKGK
jgi:hypothetical protein